MNYVSCRLKNVVVYPLGYYFFLEAAVQYWNKIYSKVVDFNRDESSCVPSDRKDL